MLLRRPSCLLPEQSRPRPQLLLGARGCVLVLHVQTEVSPHSCADEGSGQLPRTPRHKTDHYYNKDFSSSPYLHMDSTFPWATLAGQSAQSWHWCWRPPPAPWPVTVRCWAGASGVISRLLQAFEGELAPVRGVGARRAAGVGAVGWSRVFGGI